MLSEVDSDDNYIPVISGGLLGMSRRWWHETGGYDKETRRRYRESRHVWIMEAIGRKPCMDHGGNRKEAPPNRCLVKGFEDALARAWPDGQSQSGAQCRGDGTLKKSPPVAA